MKSPKPTGSSYGTRFNARVAKALAATYRLSYVTEAKIRICILRMIKEGMPLDAIEEVLYGLFEYIAYTDIVPVMVPGAGIVPVDVKHLERRAHESVLLSKDKGNPGRRQKVRVVRRSRNAVQVRPKNQGRRSRSPARQDR